MKINLSKIGAFSALTMIIVMGSGCAKKLGGGAGGAVGGSNTPQACVSQMTLESAKRVSSDKLDIGHGNGRWALVAGEMIINIKTKENGVDKVGYARVGVKQTNDNVWSASLDCATLNDHEGDIEIPFGLITVDDRSQSITQEGDIILNPKNKSATLKVSKSEKVSLKSYVAASQIPAEGFKISSFEVYKNSSKEMVFKTTLLRESGSTQLEFIKIQKLQLQ